TVQHLVHEARESERSGDADEHAKDGHLHVVGEHEAQNVPAARAESHANADFLGALADEIRNDAVDANAGKKQRERGEDAEEYHGEAASSERIRDDLVYGQRAEEDLLAAHLPASAADGIEEAGRVV